MTRNSQGCSWRSRFLSVLSFAAVFLSAGSCFLRGTEDKALVRPIVQPLPFSHKRHQAAGLACVDCHAGAKTKEVAGFPPERVCMACHISIAVDSPAIRRLAEAQKSGQPIRWIRVYHLPNFVFFSHASHAKAGVNCVACHGPVAERDVLAAEVSTKMQKCVDCHRDRHASIECSLCHQLGQ